MRLHVVHQSVATKPKKSDELPLACPENTQTSNRSRTYMNLEEQPLPLLCFSPPKPQVVNVLWQEKDTKFNLNYQVMNVTGVPCSVYQVTIQLEDEESIRLIESSQPCSQVQIYRDSLTLALETRDGVQVFCRESQPLFNVYVSSQSSRGSSIIVMESLTDDHWSRMKDLIFASRSFQKISRVGLDIDYSKDNFGKPIVSFSSVRQLDINYITNGMESLSFFQNLSLEDQIIILKETTYLVVLFLMSHSYDQESESFISKTPLENLVLSFCLNKNRLLTSNNGRRMHEFYIQFLESFHDFLLKDTFVIMLLCILCVLDDRPGLSCTEILDYERKLHLEILDQYIKAKLVTEQWSLDKDCIWNHIYDLRREVEKYGSIRLTFVKEREAQFFNSPK